mmetsp:Transcript_24856/g.60034  ORF Transcript_24856/g.60034 Transcript_24856/m.60034 type:complete len:95 (-) Transcript_24856:1086-1370(-)
MGCVRPRCTAESDVGLYENRFSSSSAPASSEASSPSGAAICASLVLRPMADSSVSRFAVPPFVGWEAELEAEGRLDDEAEELGEGSVEGLPPLP